MTKLTEQNRWTGAGEKSLQRIKEWRDKNREHLTAYNREYKRKWRARKATDSLNSGDKDG